MARILVIEDETDLQQVLDYNLRQAGHEVRIASRGNEGLKQAKDEHPDLILLDLMLPDTSGNEVCKQLKKTESTATIPVMMLTAKGEEIDRVLGFELGADDYVVKPFSVRELLLRIQAVLRRHSTRDASSHATFGRLRIDREAHRVWVGEEEITLTALEFKLLLALFDGRNRVQTRSVLLDGVWGYDAEVTTRTVDTHVKRLRQKLGVVGDYIETIRGVGYRFADAPPEVAA
jgi:two-component system phosphate regulon response regulator PhoB